jgi:hypothetical protein
MNTNKRETIQLIASITLVLVTAFYAYTSHSMVSLMQKTNIGDLRPYLFIKLLSQPNGTYFSYNGNGRGTLYYRLDNNGKVTANNIIRSYKVYKIDKSNKISITRPTYVNIDYVFSLSPQEPLEGQPDTIDGINFQKSDINNNYYVIELWVSYEGAQGINEIGYYSSIGIEVQPLECNQEGNWKYSLYIKHRGEGVDQNLKEFWQWYNSDKPLNIKNKEQLENTYLKNKREAENMFFSKDTCKHIDEILFGNNGYWIAIGLLFSWLTAILLGDVFVKGLINYLQKKSRDIFNSSKEEYTALKDKWSYWVIDTGLGKYNALLGAFEVTFFYICLLFSKPEGIGVWLVFKVAAKWESWANIVKFPAKLKGVDDFGYLKLRNDLATSVLQRFLIGTILNILIAFIGVAIFYMVRIAVMAEGLIQKFWLIPAVGIIIFLICIFVEIIRIFKYFKIKL